MEKQVALSLTATTKQELLVAADLQGSLANHKRGNTVRCDKPGQVRCSRAVHAPERPRTCSWGLVPIKSIPTGQVDGSAVETGSLNHISMLQEPGLSMPCPGGTTGKGPALNGWSHWCPYNVCAGGGGNVEKGRSPLHYHHYHGSLRVFPCVRVCTISKP